MMMQEHSKLVMKWVVDKRCLVAYFVIWHYEACRGYLSQNCVMTLDEVILFTAKAWEAWL